MSLRPSQIAMSLSIAEQNLLRDCCGPAGFNVPKLNGAPLSLMQKRLISKDDGVNSATWHGYKLEPTALGRAVCHALGSVQ